MSLLTRLDHGRAAIVLPPLALLAMAAAWGSTFFVIKDLVVRLPAADLLAVRFSIAAVAMLLLTNRRLRLDRATIGGGVLLGVLYGAGQLLQTVGLQTTSASVSGFITGLYVVATPLLAAIVFKIRIGRLTWVAVALATVGLGVLSLRGFSIGGGELLTLISAVVYGGHIIVTDRFSTRERVLALTTVQMITIALVCWVAAVPDGITWPQGQADWGQVVYLALISGALAILLQTWAQARVRATRAAVIMSMEPVWAAIFAVGLGGELITGRMLVGGAAILGAMYLVELGPWLARRRNPARVEAPVREVR
ncbi:MAG: DMT family transporter [Propionibacteriaceae bacterium]